MSAMLKFKYYGYHIMSRKFKYRYIEIIKGSAIVMISSLIFWISQLFISFKNSVKTFDT